MVLEKDYPDKMELILMVGIPGSGKTTYAQRHFPSHTHVSLDKLKAMPRNQRLQLYRKFNLPHPKRPNQNRPLEDKLIEQAMQQEKSIIVDDTNLTIEIRKRHISAAQRYGYTVNAIFFKNIKQAYEQNCNRKKCVPQRALDIMVMQLEEPTKDEGISCIRLM